jgi:hypothetical protein
VQAGINVVGAGAIISGNDFALRRISKRDRRHVGKRDGEKGSN